MVYAGRKFFFIVCHHDECLALSLAEGLDDVAGTLAVVVIKAVERFVEDEEFRVFDERTGQECHPLFAARQREVGTGGQMVQAEHFHPQVGHGAFFGADAAVEANRVVQTAGHDVRCRQVLFIRTEHFGRHVADVAFYIPDALARATSTAEEIDVAGIRLRVVGANKGEKRRFAGAVLARQGPMLTPAHAPRQAVEDGACAVSDADVAEGHYAVRHVVVRMGRQAEDAVASGGCEAFMLLGLPGQVVSACLFGVYGAFLDGDDMRDEVRDVFGACHDEHYRHPVSQRGQEPGQHRPGRLVEPDERVVDHEHAGERPQRSGQLEAAQFAARQLDNSFVEQLVDAQQCPKRGAVFCVGRTAFEEQFPHRGPYRLVALIPPLLVVGRFLAVAVGIAKGYVFHVVRDACAPSGSEVVCRCAVKQGSGSRHEVDQERFPGSVRASDGYLFARFNGYVCRFGQAELRHPGDACLYFDNFLHSSGVIRVGVGRLTRFWFWRTNSAHERAPPPACPKRAARVCSR